MRIALAEKLLISIMEWGPEQILKQRPLLQALANFKYDEYQQFSIGTRFIESLVKWLKQFETLDERNVAYDFVVKNLIFVSNQQMLHLVNMTFTDCINPKLISQTANKLGIAKYLIHQIIKSKKYEETARRSLYIGLSDGSRIDQLRRSSKLNNEQVILTYTINKDKANDLVDNLKKSGYDSKFNTFFLIDDFTASGTSYFRLEAGNGKGKIFKTLDSLFDSNKDLYLLAEHTEQLHIHIIFYIATQTSINKLTDSIEEWKKLNLHNFIFTIQAVQTISDNVKDVILNETKLLDLSKKYIKSTIVDSHFEKARHEKYYLGYDEGALPLILVHNAPNNSLPLLWWNSEDFTGLFPRTKRHK